jgi:large subunit ribosomal protein L30
VGYFPVTREVRMIKKLQITWKRSTIGYPNSVKEVVKGLGLRKLHQTVIRSNTPEIRGMVKKVIHLLNVSEIEIEE